MRVVARFCDVDLPIDPINTDSTQMPCCTYVDIRDFGDLLHITVSLRNDCLKSAVQPTPVGSPAARLPVSLAIYADMRLPEAHESGDRSRNDPTFAFSYPVVRATHRG